MTGDMTAIAYKGVESTPTWLVIPLVLLSVLGIALAWRKGRN
ncbi:hypothetical protein AB0Q95_10385 [Streptomyces sp. NPDC059900]